MALTKISSNEIQTGAVTQDKIATTVSLGGPKITTVNVANSAYTVLDDTAVNTGGGYIVVTGSGFESGAVVLVENTPATSTTFVNTSTLRAEVPSRNAATYNIYVSNPDGGVGLKLNGLTYSGTPTWVTASALANVQSNTAFTGSLSATGATSYANTTALPAGFNLVTANGYYYGNISVGSTTTYNFTIRATDAENQDSDRSFSLIATIVSAPTSVEYLVVAGGGGGGKAGAGGGGGGAGGYRTGTLSVSAATPYTVTVGGGGAGATVTYGVAGANGSDSIFSTITSTGGGGGASGVNKAGADGGSGGGGAQRAPGSPGGLGNTPSTSPSQGNNGGAATSNPNGDAGGGGGGAGAAGSQAPGATSGGAGGVGVQSSITGTAIYYAGGGGGSGDVSGASGGLGGGGTGGSGTQGTAGTTNTGGGGGGNGNSAYNGNAGGSGIVIIRYADTFLAATSTTGSPTITTSGGYRIYQWTGSGSITF